MLSYYTVLNENENNYKKNDNKMKYLEIVFCFKPTMN